MSISLFTPIYSDFNQNPIEKCAFLRSTTQFFDFGQKTYMIKPYEYNSRIEVIESERSKSWIGTAMRVIAFLTVIIPLLMLVGAWVYHKVNDFQIGNSVNHLDQLPEDIMKVIFQEVGPETSLHIGSACKKYSEIVGRYPASMLLKALEESCRSFDEKDLGSILRNGALSKMIGTLAYLDPEKALEKITRIDLDSIYHIATYANIIKALGLSNPQKAAALAEKAAQISNQNRNIYYWEESEALAKIAGSLFLSNPVKAVELAEEVLTKESHDIDSIAHIAEILLFSNPEKWMEILGQCIDRFSLPAQSLTYNEDLAFFLCEVSKTFAKAALQCPEKAAEVRIFALEKINALDSGYYKSLALASIARFSVDPQEKEQFLDQAVAEARLEMDGLKKSQGLAVLSAFFDSPMRASEIALEAFDEAHAIETLDNQSIAFKTIALLTRNHLLNQCKEWAEVVIARVIQMEDKSKSSINLARISWGLSRVDLKRAIEVVNTIPQPQQYCKVLALSKIVQSSLEPPEPIEVLKDLLNEKEIKKEIDEYRSRHRFPFFGN